MFEDYQAVSDVRLPKNTEKFILVIIIGLRAAERSRASEWTGHTSPFADWYTRRCLPNANRFNDFWDDSLRISIHMYISSGELRKCHKT